MENSKYNGKNNIIGNCLKKYRREKNMSQEQLCNKLALLGITLYKNDIYRIENNKRVVKDFELWGIAKVLDVKMEDFIEL